jgi:hypothetical protein
VLVGVAEVAVVVGGATVGVVAVTVVVGPYGFHVNEVGAGAAASAKIWFVFPPVHYDDVSTPGVARRAGRTYLVGLRLVRGRASGVEALVAARDREVLIASVVPARTEPA